MSHQDQGFRLKLSIKDYASGPDADLLLEQWVDYSLEGTKEVAFQIAYNKLKIMQSGSALIEIFDGATRVSCFVVGVHTLKPWRTQCSCCQREL